MDKPLNYYRWKGHQKLKLICPVCGNEFLTFQSAVKRGTKCCSNQCRNTIRKGTTGGQKHYNWNGGKIKKQCLVCQKEFSVKREQEKRTGAKFCSFSCRSIYNVRYNHGSQSTDIENITEKMLIDLGALYEKQVSISGVALVDFMLPGKKIIQCDGDYWHSLPETAQRDKKQNQYFIDNGYLVLRLLGSKIKKSPGECRNRISKYLTVENRADGVGLGGEL